MVMKILLILLIWVILGVIVWGRIYYIHHKATSESIYSDREGRIVLTIFTLFAPVSILIFGAYCIDKREPFKLMYWLKEDAEWTDVAWRHVARQKGKQVWGAVQWTKRHTVGRKRAKRS